MRDTWSDPGQHLYRYTVKCDRERFHAIENVARARGLSATQLVQVHFEGILDDCEPAERPKAEASPSSCEEIETARRHGLTAGTLRVYRAVAASKDAFDRAEIGVGTIAARTGFTEGSVRVLLTKLVNAGHLRRRSGGGWRRTTVYQVEPLEVNDDAPVL